MQSFISFKITKTRPQPSTVIPVHICAINYNDEYTEYTINYNDEYIEYTSARG